MILLGILCFPAGWEQEITIFYFLGLFYILFGLYIIRSRQRPTLHVPMLSDETHPGAELLEEYPIVRPVHPEGFLVGGQEYIYPLKARIYKAMTIDYVLLFTALVIAMILTDEMENRTAIMLTSLASLILTYEPLLTVYGVTAGQKMMGIRVRKVQNPAERISLPNAYLRVVTKTILGRISFITVNNNPEHRAIHDLISGSVMIREIKSQQ